jgi:hypothetical protein
MAAHPPESSTASGPICPYMTLCRLGTSRRQRVSVPSGRGRPRRSGRVYLDRPVPVLQVVEVRYQAGGEFGSGFKPRPKSDASIRELPLAPLVIESIRRQLPPTATPTSSSSPAPEAATGSRSARARCCLGTTFAVSTSVRSLAHAMTLLRSIPSWPSRSAPHLLDLAGRRRHSRSGDR